MLHLILATVCQVASPDGGRSVPVCKDIEFQIETETPGEQLLPQQCQLIGETVVAEWVSKHPFWKNVQRISCPPRKKKTQDI
jgi:hypothetical protein